MYRKLLFISFIFMVPFVSNASVATQTNDTVDVWQLDSIECIMVEDFDSYDDDGNDIGAVWADKHGWGDMEITRVSDPCISPLNAMKMEYSIYYDPFYAIAARSFSPAQDWTALGVEILTIHYSALFNYGLPMFVTVGDGTTDANVVVDVNTAVEGWQEINVSLVEIAAAGVDLTNVSYMEIGFGDGTGFITDRYGAMYIDDISLCPAKCVLSESTLAADITEDCVVNYDDLVYITDAWLFDDTDLLDGDLNDDDAVDFKDYSILASEWLVEDFWP